MNLFNTLGIIIVPSISLNPNADYSDINLFKVLFILQIFLNLLHILYFVIKLIYFNLNKSKLWTDKWYDYLFSDKYNHSHLSTNVVFWIITNLACIITYMIFLIINFSMNYLL